MGSAAKLPVERTNKKTKAKMLVQLKRKDVFFMAYLLLLKSIPVRKTLVYPANRKKN
jgi:hypothetical protein